jgi:hypothetical protein
LQVAFSQQLPLTLTHENATASADGSAVTRS